MLPSCGDKTVEPIEDTSKYFVYHTNGGTTTAFKRYLYLSPEFIFVRIDSGTTIGSEKINTIINIVPSILDTGYLNMDPSMDPKSVDGVFLRTKTLISESTMEQVVEKLNNDSHIRYAEPFYAFNPSTSLDERIEEFTSIGEIVLKLKNKSNVKDLEALIGQWKVIKYRQYEYDSLIYILSVDKYSSGNALRLSNKFYESGICEWSETNGQVIYPNAYRRKL